MNIDKKHIVAGLAVSAVMLHTGMSTSFADVEYRTITADAVNFRSGPSTNYSSLGKLNKGDKVKYISESGSWIKVKYNNTTGYVYGSYVSEAIQSTDTKYVSATSLNFRSGASTSSSIIGSLSKGTKVEVLSESNGWSKIKYNGQIGYVSSKYLVDKVTDSDSSTTTTTKYVSATSLNFRSGASTTSSIIGKLSNGTKVEVLSESNGWSKIKYNGQIGYVSSQYLSVKIESDTSNSASAVISYAKSLLGKPYIWGAEGPNSFDCSGYTQYVFKNSANATIPRTSSQQSKYGTYISKSNLKPGDLVFFDTSGSNDGNVSHVGIYIGSNQFIHCSSSKAKVVISQLDSSYYTGAYVNARRVL
ncbi:MAG: SH3 domain-containing protein [Terrisporobacter sp.]|uniref:C40 family peptidase n=1 Tax=Terrisporobacter sp. TaxID=1965305 RepID=UPI002FC5B10F